MTRPALCHSIDNGKLNSWLHECIGSKQLNLDNPVARKAGQPLPGQAVRTALQASVTVQITPTGPFTLLQGKLAGVAGPRHSSSLRTLCRRKKQSLFYRDKWCRIWRIRCRCPATHRPCARPCCSGKDNMSVPCTLYCTVYSTTCQVLKISAGACSIEAVCKCTAHRFRPRHVCKTHFWAVSCGAFDFKMIARECSKLTFFTKL
jgi:hypothetical protein